MVHGGGSRHGGSSRATSNDAIGSSSTNNNNNTSSRGSRRQRRNNTNTNNSLSSSPTPITHGGGSRNIRNTTTETDRNSRRTTTRDANRPLRHVERIQNTQTPIIHRGGGTATRSRDHDARQEVGEESRQRYRNRFLPNSSRVTIPRNNNNENDDDDDDECCNSCCGPHTRTCGLVALICAAIWGCLVCFCRPVTKSKLLRSTILPLLVTLILGCFLVILTGQKEMWSLNAGISRQVLPHWYIRAIDVQVTTLHSAVNVSVYALKDKCPPLSGPIVEVDELHTMKFQPGEYQYDYFYLNRGSKVTATLTQTQGSGITYLLKGEDRIKILEDGPNEEQLENLLFTAVQSWNTNDDDRQQQEQQQEQSQNPTMARFRADRNDFYVLLYDNPFARQAQLNADLSLDLTTYDLKNYDPICKDVAFQSCPPLPSRGIKCMIVETSAGHAGEHVSLRVVGHRNWTLILFLSSIPTILWIIWVIWACFSKLVCGPTRQSLLHEEEEDDEGLAEPLLQSSRDPPIAPSAPTNDDTGTTTITSPPSAPPASEDIVIPMAEAQIIDSPPTVAAASVVIPIEAPAETADNKPSTPV